MNIRKEIGKNLKKARIEKDISQEELAERISTSTKHFNSLENGNYSFLNVDLIYKASKVLDVPFETLFKIK